MLADELDVYKGRGNQYIEDNIQEIEDLYKNEENKVESRKEKVEEVVILIRPYKVLELTLSTTKSSFINSEVDNLMKYMKFVQSPTQTRLFSYDQYLKDAV